MTRLPIGFGPELWNEHYGSSGSALVLWDQRPQAIAAAPPQPHARRSGKQPQPLRGISGSIGGVSATPSAARPHGRNFPEMGSAKNPIDKLDAVPAAEFPKSAR